MKTLQNKTVAVIGAGPSGLAAAVRLQQQGAKVTVFDKRDYVGGRTRSIRIDGFTFDVGALVLVPSCKNVLGLIKELDPNKTIYKTKPSFGFIRDGKRHSIDFAHPFRALLSTKLLSWPSKLKMLKVAPVLLKYWSRINFTNLGDLAELDNESTRDFCLRVLNEEVDDYLANPVSRLNAFTGTRTTPATEWIWQLGAFLTPHIIQIDKGMVSFAELLARDLDVRLNTEIARVSRDDGKAVLQIRNSNESTSASFDACILAIPPMFANKIAPMESPQQERFFSDVKPMRIITLHLGLKSRPDIQDSVILIPEKESPDLLLIQLDHNKAPDRAPDGKAIVTVWSSIEWTAAHDNLSDEDVAAQLLKLTERFTGQIGHLIEVSLVNRWDFVLPVTYPGYYTKLRDYMAARDLNQPLFYAGDFVSGGIEGATTSGLDAYRNVERYLTQ